MVCIYAILRFAFQFLIGFWDRPLSGCFPGEVFFALQQGEVSFAFHVIVKFVLGANRDISLVFLVAVV